ncbi:MAG: putative HMG box protein, partial [Piptocephalis tieghemiana]
RPPNSFILYRSDRHKDFRKVHPTARNEEISRMIGAAWRHEDERVKQRYQSLARERSEEHRRLYPHYRYQPKR